MESARLQERLESAARAGGGKWMPYVAGFCPRGDALVACASACAYDPASDSWYEIDLHPSLQTLTDRTGVEALPGWATWEEESSFLDIPPASAGGGVLMGNVVLEDDGWEVITPYLGNPAARSYAMLPSFPDGLSVSNVRGLFVDHVACCFKLVAVGKLRDIYTWVSDHEGVKTFVCDSKLEEWSETTRAVHPGGKCKFKVKAGQGVFVGTVLYCLSPVCSLLAYDLERASWSLLKLEKPAEVNDIFHCSLVNVRDRLLCVALARDSSESFLQIWEIDFAAKAWTVVEDMPAAMFTHFRGDTDFKDKSSLHVRVVAGQDEVYIMQEKLDKIVALDLSQKPAAWRWLPSLPFQDFVRKSFHCFDPLLEFRRMKKDKKQGV